MAEDPHVLRGGVFTRQYYTVTTLPAAASQQGEWQWVSDANASPWTNHGETAVGGGTIRSKVMSDGTVWKLHF